MSAPTKKKSMKNKVKTPSKTIAKQPQVDAVVTQLPGGYRVISYQYGEEPNAALRQSFFKEHSTKTNDKGVPKGQTLFVLNPPKIEGAVKRLFERFGKIKNLKISEMDDAGNTVLIVFKTAAGLENAMKHASNAAVILDAPNNADFGMQRWQLDHDNSIPDVATLQATLDEDMKNFDDKVAQEKALKLATHGQADDEGWMTITRTGAGGHESGETASSKAHKKTTSMKKDKKNRELQNFYRFQRKEARQDQIAQLREKFDQDKLKIKSLRENRKFRPY